MGQSRLIKISQPFSITQGMVSTTHPTRADEIICPTKPQPVQWPLDGKGECAVYRPSDSNSEKMHVKIVSTKALVLQSL